MIDLSIVIPVYKDPYVYPTMRGILEKFETNIEIIPVFDGCEPTLPVPDTRVKPIFLEKQVGMRGAINAGVAKAKGKYLMRTDAHCVFGQGFDRIILETIEDNWIVDAKRYFLDPIKWEVMDKEPIEMERLIISERHNKFAAVPWRERDSATPIKPKMAMQGSVWVMPHNWWDDVIGELQVEGYGTLYQDSTEMTMKTWKAGGKLMLNSNTWYAHKERNFSRTHDYPNKLSRASWDYALDQWKDYYEEYLCPLFGITRP